MTTAVESVPRLLRDVPIERKLTIIVMLTSGAALALACLAFILHEMVVFRGTMVSDLSSAAIMVADSSSAALAFDDRGAAARTLGSLSAHPHVVGAAIYDSEGEVFATYERTGSEVPFASSPARADTHRFSSDRLELFRNIDLMGEIVGSIYIRSDLDGMWERLRRYGMIVLLVMLAASLAALLLSKKLQTAISGPISQLVGIAHAVAADKNYSVRARPDGSDELGRLIDAFNDMLSQIQERDRALQATHDSLERRVADRTRALRKEIAERRQAQEALEALHQQLVEASRRAGMAEIATNVLHNVGNVLNSVNVSASLVANSVSQFSVAGLRKASDLLQAQGHELGSFLTTHPRGRHFPAYLTQLADQLQTEQSSATAELEALRANIEHIKEIVSMQQNYARVSGIQEMKPVIGLVEDALAIDAAAFSRHGVQLVREFHANPTINVDKHKLLQILVNLVRNAKNACDESTQSHKQLTVRIDSAAAAVRISVIDNGVGIAPENLTRIFSHGFTTRKDGHGFGLHGSALAARDLGGSLSVESAGIGKGAMFVLELPVIGLAQ